MSIRGWIAARVAAAAVFATACGGRGGAGRLDVSARTVQPAAATAAAAGLDLGDGIVLTGIQLAVQRISLEGAAAATSGAAVPGTASKEGGASGGDGSGGDGASGGGGGMDDGSAMGEVSVGPFAVDLGADALAGGIHPVFDSDVPAGTYRELRIAVGPVAGAEMGSALAALAGRSFVADGTIDGAPFEFASSLSATRKLELTVQVAADGSSSGVTLTIDPRGWFHAADGSRLDPRLDGSRAAIEDAVRASIGAELEDEHGAGGEAGHG